MRNKVRISMMAGIVLVIAVLCACGNASDKETSNGANGSDSNNSGTEVQVGELMEFNYYPGYSDMDGGYHYEVLKKNDDGEWIFESDNQNSLDDPLTTTIYAVTNDDVKEFEKFLDEKGIVSLQERMDSDVFVTDYSPWSYSIVFADPSSDEGKEIWVSIGQYKEYSDEDYELLKELDQRFKELKGVVLSETVESEEL